MVSEMIEVAAALEAIRERAAAKDYDGAAKRAIELGLDLLPAGELRAYLDEAAAARADAIADAAERIKVAP
jgi:hypothetical protein